MNKPEHANTIALYDMYFILHTTMLKLSKTRQTQRIVLCAFSNNLNIIS